MIRYGILEQMKYGLAAESWDSDLTTYMSGLSTPLSTTQKDLLQTFVTSLKTGLGITNLSDAFDTMYILANETEEAALRNLVKRQHDCIAVNSPTFTQYEGFQGNGTSQYLNTNYNPSTNGVNYTNDSASFGVYFRTPRATSNTMAEGVTNITTNCDFYPFRNNTIRFYINDNTANTLIIYNMCGLDVIYRISSTQKKASKNKTLGSASNANTIGKPDGSLYLMAYNSNGTTPSGYETSQISLGFTGKNLLQSDLNALYDSFEAYMNSRNKGFLYFSYPSVLTDGSTVGWYVADASNTTMYMSQDTSVYAWCDILGSGHDLIQATGSAQPQWTSDGLLFDGANDYMKTAAFTWVRPQMVYMVVKQITWTSGDRLFDGNATNGGALMQNDTTPELGLYTSGAAAVAQNSNLPLGQFGIVRALLNGTNSKLQINNTVATTGSLDANDMGGFTLCRQGGSSLQWANIQVKEIILRNVADNETDETAIYNYLANKYGIT